MAPRMLTVNLNRCVSPRAIFAGRVERMAAVHHFGLRDWPSVHSKDVKYNERPLLGFDNVTLDQTEITCIEHTNIGLLYLI